LSQFLLFLLFFFSFSFSLYFLFNFIFSPVRWDLPIFLLDAVFYPTLGTLPDTYAQIFQYSEKIANCKASELLEQLKAEIAKGVHWNGVEFFLLPFFIVVELGFQFPVRFCFVLFSFLRLSFVRLFRFFFSTPLFLSLSHIRSAFLDPAQSTLCRAGRQVLCDHHETDPCEVVSALAPQEVSFGEIRQARYSLSG
jgi:hypothetical protein